MLQTAEIKTVNDNFAHFLVQPGLLYLLVKIPVPVPRWKLKSRTGHKVQHLFNFKPHD